MRTIRKILIFDLAKRTEEVFSCTISDLEAFYNKQLPKIGGVVEELVLVNREKLNWLWKVCTEVNIA